MLSKRKVKESNPFFFSLPFPFGLWIAFVLFPWSRFGQHPIHAGSRAFLSRGTNLFERATSHSVVTIQR